MRRDGVLHLYDQWDDARRDIDKPGWSEGALVKGLIHHTSDGRVIDAHEATPPPPAPAIPELPAGETPTVPGFYFVKHPQGTVGAYDIKAIDFWGSRTGCRYAGPIPLPSFARDRREGGQDA